MKKFDDNKNIKTYSTSVIVRRLFSYLKPVLPLFIISLLVTIILSICEVLPSYIQGVIFDILANEEKSNISKKNTCITISAIYAGLVIIFCVANYLNKMALQRIGQKVVMNMRNDVFVKIEGLSIAQFNEVPVGKLVTRVTSDINMINELFTSVIINLIRYTFIIIFVFGMMIYISPRLTLYVSMLIPFLVLISVLFNKISRKQYRKVRGCVSNVNAFLTENISGMKITQIFNQEDKKLDEFNEKNNQLKKASVNEVLIFGIFRPLIFIIFITARIIVLYYGLKQIRINKLTIGKYVTFHQLVGNFFNPIQDLADQFNKLQQAFASSERVFEILDKKADILDSDDAIEIENFQGKIEFSHVWFAYNDDNWILKDVSFKVNPKETVAFVGATGAGKTTILALIVRNYEIQKGEIKIDDIPIKKIKIESLRKHIGQMLQDVFLFSGSIKNNITLRDDNFSNEEVYEACKYVNADRIINKLDGGLEYKVLERGSNFSAGERQLLSFARTVISKPNIMILDEATANIDTETETLIQNSLEKMRNIGTMLVVAHRLSTVQHADKIIVLNKGVIMEMGNHQELLDKKGLYFNLYELQYKHNE